MREATKVQMDSSGFISRIGKGLYRWDAIDTGVFLLTHRFIQVATELILHEGMGLEISEVIQHIVDFGGRFATCDATGLFWADMDTEEDLYSATFGRSEWSLGTTASSQDT
jgi:choline kinase